MTSKHETENSAAVGGSELSAGLGIERDMLISLRTFQDDEDGSFGVEVIVSGLKSQQQADKAIDFIQGAICGKEMVVN